MPPWPEMGTHGDPVVGDGQAAEPKGLDRLVGEQRPAVNRASGDGRHPRKQRLEAEDVGRVGQVRVDLRRRPGNPLGELEAVGVRAHGWAWAK